MTSKRDVASFSSRCAREIYRVVSTNRLALPREHLQQIAERRPQSREAFKRAQLEELVQEKRRRLVAAAGPGLIEKCQGRVEGLARRRRLGSGRHAERRCGDDRLIRTFGSGRGALEIDVLALHSPEPLAQPVEQLCTSGAEIAEDYRYP